MTRLLSPAAQVEVTLADDGTPSFITGAFSAVDSSVKDPVGPVVVCLGQTTPSRPQTSPTLPLESCSTRAPPHPFS